MALIVRKEHVSASTSARVSICGTPITLHHESGRKTDTRWSCGSAWCSYCSRVHALHVADCIAGKIDSGREVMLTLTLPHLDGALERALGGAMSPGALSVAVDRQRAVWRRTMERVRWWRWWRAQGDFGRAAQNAPPPSRHGGVHPVFASTWNGGWSVDGPLGYVWALEVTAGRSGSHWHVHRHVLVVSREWAEVVNAAWQASCVELGYLGEGEWSHTDITESVSERVASYLAGIGTFEDDQHAGRAMGTYLARSKDLSSIPTRWHGSYVAAMRNVRRYDAGGTWRPLGVARPSPDDAVVAVEVPSWPDVLVEPAEWWALDSPIAEWVVRQRDYLRSRPRQQPHHKPQPPP